jgi:nitroimidazol reductase NimA-like FMN-containing flavoprotein (pyridoxamine 5'-phosphate oxidase superfamily)
VVIGELSKDACLDLLARVQLGRLACSRANQPYICPLFFAYHEHSLYCASTIGKKIKWMRENPVVSILFDEIESAQRWTTVIIQGRYEELPDTPETQDGRQLAWTLLQKRKLWWEPGYARTILSATERPMAPLYFRIRVEQISGHYALNDPTHPQRGT